MYTEYMPPEAKPGDPIWTMSIMSYEHGSVVRSLIRGQCALARGDMTGAKAHFATARIELSDMITQCHVLAEQMSWKWLDLENDGMERFQRRMEELSDVHTCND